MLQFDLLYTNDIGPKNSSWLHDDEEIFMDVATCALAFRILRANGYDVLSGTL